MRSAGGATFDREFCILEFTAQDVIVGECVQILFESQTEEYVGISAE